LRSVRRSVRDGIGCTNDSDAARTIGLHMPQRIHDDEPVRASRSSVTIATATVITTVDIA
jgi:hypothetical protein